MKKTKKCPKCGSNDIIRIPGFTGGYGAGNNIPVGFTIFSAVKVSRYLCGGCGFSEEWIDSKTDLRKLRSKYK
jgi:ribosomal protein S27AE